MEIDNKLEHSISSFINKSNLIEGLNSMRNKNQSRLEISLDKLREHDEVLLNAVMTKPLSLIPFIEQKINGILDEGQSSKKGQNSEKVFQKEKLKRTIKVTFNGMFGKNMVSPRGLSAQLTNNLVHVTGIVTRMSIVRPLLVKSVHYCEETRNGFTKTYTDQFSLNNAPQNANIAGYTSNTVPVRDNHGNALSFEYGLSNFKDYQVLLVQEPPERTPVGQLPRSVEVILEDDLVDRVKPGDRIQAVGVFKCISSQSTSQNGSFKTIVLATNISACADESGKKFSGEDVSQIKNLAKRRDCFDVLANSIAPSIFGHEYIKKALLLQLLGGVEKNLDNGTHLRGDINILLIGDPSTAKSQFLRNIISLAPNAINTTGRGSTGVGLTAAVVVDKDTGERHLEAGAMVLGDKGIVCIDEFDKMNDIDRVSIHEVMEQQTVTIAKAGIHCSLNARCSVLAAANPIYGEYQKEIPAAKNIGLPDSLLSRFDLVFIVLDEESTELDRLIADRVVKNHMFPSDTPTLLNILDEKIVEPDLTIEDNDHSTQVFEKHSHLLQDKHKKDVLTKSFLKKYISYAKLTAKEPVLKDEAVNFISDAWTRLRANDVENTNSFRAVPITVRTLETLIRLASAHAKLRLSLKVEKQDCEVALELLNYALYHDETSNAVEAKDIEMGNENEMEEDDSEYNKKFRTNKKSGKSDKSEKTRAKTKNTSDVKKSRNLIDEDDDSVAAFQVEESEFSDKKSKKSSARKAKGNEEVENILSSKVSSGVTEEQKKYIFKLIYESVNNTTTKQTKLSELWTKVQKTKQFSRLSPSIEVLEQILQALDIDNKILYAANNKDIILI